MFLRVSVVFLVSTGLLGVASADVIFENVKSHLVQLGLSSCGGSLSVDDCFVLKGANTIADIYWRGYHFLSSRTDDSTIFSYDDLGNALLYTFDGAGTFWQDTHYDRGPGPGYLPEFHYSTNMDSLSFMRGQTYRPGIENISGADGNWGFTATAHAHIQIILATLDNAMRTALFDMTDSVEPEPASITFLGAGMGGICSRGGRRISAYETIGGFPESRAVDDMCMGKTRSISWRSHT